MANIFMEYYTGKEQYSEGNDVERDILKYIKNNKNNEYNNVFESDNRWTVFYHLTDIRRGLLEWYPFSKDSTVLEIGAGMGALTGVLCEKCDHVTSVELTELRAQAIYYRYKDVTNLDIYVGNVLDMKFDKKFDYITLIGVLEYQGNYISSDAPYCDFLKQIKKFLKPNGKLLIAIENKFGIKYWCGVPEDHTGRLFDSINNYPTVGKARTFSKHELKTLLDNSGFKNSKFFYPMPDYKLPQVIFSDEGLPKKYMPHRIIPYYLYYPTLIALEKDIYNDLLQNEVFDFFANSFLVECSIEDIPMCDITMASITSDRRRSHQMCTVIHQNETVQKFPVWKEGFNLLKTSYENIMTLSRHSINIVSHTLSSNSLWLPYITEESLEDKLIQACIEENVHMFYTLLEQYFVQVLNSSEQSLIEENAILATLEENSAITKFDFGPILKTAYIDLLPHNCFVINGALVFYDQEFSVPNFPANFMLFRALKNLYGFYPWINGFISIEETKQHFLLDKVWDLYEQEDALLLEELTESSVTKILGGFWYVDQSIIEKNSSFLLNRLNYEQKILELENTASQYSDIKDELLTKLQASHSIIQNQEETLSKLNWEISSLKSKKIKLENQLLENKSFNDLLSKGYKMEINENKREIEELYKQINRLLVEVASCQTKYNELINSTCWKITKPLRSLKHLLTGNLKSVSHNVASNPSTELQTVTVRPCPESILSDRESISSVVEKLSQYDIVSFDIFDTLLFRLVDQPTDIFSLVGLKLNILNFEKMRILAEQEARIKVPKKNQEIDIFDIYMFLSKYIHIDIESTIQVELDMEKHFICANPYMKQIYDALIEKDIKIIYTSDMYLPKKYIEELLQGAGYTSFYDGFVSCEYQAGKGNGKLQSIISKKYPNKNIIHIGDNYQSDIVSSNNTGWSTLYYPSCRSIGNLYRPTNFESLPASIYKSIINTHLHSGNNTFSKYYEHGFIYGGILVCGFCEWLNDFSKKNGIEKLLFLARDCDIVSKVYNQYYNELPNSYVVISRFAMWQLVFNENTEEFIQNFFKTRAELNQPCTLIDALNETDLSLLIPYLSEANLNPLDVISMDNYEKIRNFIYDNKKRIVEYFSSSCLAASQYFSAIVEDKKKVCAVDLGWGGQILVFLRDFIRNHIDLTINIQGAYIASSSNKQTNTYITSNILTTFLFSFAQNKEMRFYTDTSDGSMAAMLLEALFSSTESTLLKYAFDSQNNIEFIYGHSTGNNKHIQEMQKGILDFANLYNIATSKYKDLLHLQPVESYTPFHLISMDWDYNYKIFHDFKELEFPLPRMVSNETCTTLGQIMKNKHLIGE